MYAFSLAAITGHDNIISCITAEFHKGKLRSKTISQVKPLWYALETMSDEYETLSTF